MSNGSNISYLFPYLESNFQKNHVKYSTTNLFQVITRFLFKNFSIQRNNVILFSKWWHFEWNIRDEMKIIQQILQVMEKYDGFLVLQLALGILIVMIGKTMCSLLNDQINSNCFVYVRSLKIYLYICTSILPLINKTSRGHWCQM